MEKLKYKDHFIPATATARDALKILDQLPDTEIRTLFVLDKNVIVGTLTDGDIRRGLLKDREISQNVTLYMNTRFKYLVKNNITPEILADYRAKEIWFLPVINDKNEIEEVINLKTIRTVLPFAALIMA